MNFLITGGAGFIGSHVCERFLQHGHRVVCIDRFDDFYDRKIKEANIRDAMQHDNFLLLRGDVRDGALLAEVFASHTFDVVVHLAASAGVRPSILHPREYYENNVMGTLALLEQMRISGVTKLVFASSSSVYGNNRKTPFSEDDRVDNPISPYAATKKAGELLCHTYHAVYGMDIYCLRFFTVYGPRQRPEMAIHLFADKISKGEPITLYGGESVQRDYTYIEDICRGVESAIDRVRGFEIINLGESSPIGLVPLVRLIEDGLRRKAVIMHLPQQAGDVERTFADITKARRLLDYDPSVGIEEGIRKFCTWYLAQAKR